MLLEALQATEDGKRVRIASYHSLQYADDLTRRLRRYAEILGLKQSLISRPIKHGMDNYHLRGWEGVVFTDHYIGEWP